MTNIEQRLAQCEKRIREHYDHGQRITKLEHHCHTMTGHPNMYTGDVELCHHQPQQDAKPVLLTLEQRMAEAEKCQRRHREQSLVLVPKETKPDADEAAVCPPMPIIHVCGTWSVAGAKVTAGEAYEQIWKIIDHKNTRLNAKDDQIAALRRENETLRGSLELSGKMYQDKVQEVDRWIEREALACPEEQSFEETLEAYRADEAQQKEYLEMANAMNELLEAERDRLAARVAELEREAEQRVKGNAEARRVLIEAENKARAELATERALREQAWSCIKLIGRRLGWVETENDAAWQARIEDMAGRISAERDRLARELAEAKAHGKDMEALWDRNRSTLAARVAELERAALAERDAVTQACSAQIEGLKAERDKALAELARIHDALGVPTQHAGDADVDAVAGIVQLRAKLAAMAEKAEKANRALEMYAKAWHREVRMHYRQKVHEIDALVVATRKLVESEQAARADADALAEALRGAEKCLGYRQEHDCWPPAIEDRPDAVLRDARAALAAHDAARKETK